MGFSVFYGSPKPERANNKRGLRNGLAILKHKPCGFRYGLDGFRNEETRPKSN